MSLGDLDGEVSAPSFFQSQASVLKSIFASFQRLALSDGTPFESLKVASVVGTLLTAINHGDKIVKGIPPPATKVVLTYCVPFCVATYAAVVAKFNAEHGREIQWGGARGWGR